MKIHNSILDIESNYQCFILDIFGVLHASGVPYPNTLNALKTLKKNGKKILLLSNAPRRAEVVKKYLAETVGIEQNFYDGILTSGEVFFAELLKRKGQKVLYIGPEKDLSLLEGAGLKVTNDANEDFNFAALTGVVPNGMEILKVLKEKNKPLFCVNPDIFIVKSNGEREECAGFLAKKYEEMGGDVIYFGKPYAEVYQASLEFFKDFEKSKILAVGDGIETDVLGAYKAGIASCLCLSGLPSLEPDLQLFIEKAEAKPDFIIKAL